MKLAVFLLKRLINGVKNYFQPDDDGNYAIYQVKAFLVLVIAGVCLLIYLLKKI